MYINFCPYNQKFPDGRNGLFFFFFLMFPWNWINPRHRKSTQRQNMRIMEFMILQVMHISHTILSPICFIFTLKGKKSICITALLHILPFNTCEHNYKKRERGKKKKLSVKTSIDCWMHMRASWQSLSECSVTATELAAEDSCRKSHCQPNWG